jgi:transitional endoplasmic reticulum ATPase
VTYQDVGGLDAAKRAVIRTVEWPLRHPELFERLDVAPPTGVLLAGPPGTGKTMLAKAVAHSTDANFLAVDGPELLDRYVGESERGVRSIFERARRGSPSVLFLDEVDALAPARHSTETGATERVVSQLLTELDGLSARGEVAVLAATNRPESVDAAILRPGRIEKRVDVPPPDQSARADILAVHLEDVPTRNVDLEALGKTTAGDVGSDLAGVVREAALVAMAEHLRSESAGKTPTSLHLEERHLRSAIEKTTPSVDVTQLDLGRRS